MPDGRTRETCTACGWVNYENLRVQVAVVATHMNKMLWMRRADEPRRGFWELPGGFMEVGESPREAAAREVLEETGVAINPDALTLYVLGNISSTNEIHLLFRGDIEEQAVKPGPEAIEVDWFAELEAPWDQLAYPVGEAGLRRFYRDIRENDFGIYYSELREDSLFLDNYFRLEDMVNAKFG